MRNRQKKERKTFREKVADSFEVSKDVILDVPKIELLGNYEAVIENHKGIVEYTPDRIVLEANPRRIRISGRNMEIKSVTQEMLFVAGTIDGIGFLKEE